ncbi:hypothetical protein ACFTZI_00050 [Streptomyces decoyicus]|uniref:hypothetical protein n=1 Tax=Streptomyces decoyicus TaxID=249567 RepID=UPI00362D78C0
MNTNISQSGQMGPVKSPIPMGLRIYLCAVAGSIAQCVYPVLCAALRSTSAAACPGFQPFESWQSVGALVGFALVFNLGSLALIQSSVTAAPKAQCLLGFGAGWGLMGLIAPFLP